VESVGIARVTIIGIESTDCGHDVIRDADVDDTIAPLIALQMLTNIPGMQSDSVG